MTATSSDRGHPTHYDYERKAWVYDDTGEPVNDSRPCAHCGRVPTPEGYDACLGHIPGAMSACCGHGEAKQAILIMEDESHAEFDYSAPLPSCPVCGCEPPAPLYYQCQKVEHRCRDQEGRLIAVIGPIFVELWEGTMCEFKQKMGGSNA